MSIIGIGTDLCRVERINELLSKSGEALPQRLLTSDERTQLQKEPSPNWLAKRWAAKEAVAKALGTGIGGNLSFQDIQISKTEANQPIVTLLGEAATRWKGVRLHLSISDDGDYAMASVAAEQA